jgi:hypothetical protein
VILRRENKKISNDACPAGGTKMRYCPQCFAEYEDFEKLCPECGCGLPRREFMPDSENASAILVTVAAFEKEAEASLSRTGLAAEGIWSYITEQNQDTQKQPQPGFSNYVLQVSAANAPNAIRILQRLWSGALSS